MVAEKSNQLVLISGESGSGKTEVMLIIIDPKEFLGDEADPAILDSGKEQRVNTKA